MSMFSNRWQSLILVITASSAPHFSFAAVPSGPPETKPEYVNHLIHEKSPYLLQHAHNPVDWYPWGEEAFAKARKENKPIFLSVGYSTCHWCHVMERESYADPEIARVMNANFVSIKVDREQRPDVDYVYMMFVQATTGSGGWPMNVWLTPSSNRSWAVLTSQRRIVMESPSLSGYCSRSPTNGTSGESGSYPLRKGSLAGFKRLSGPAALPVKRSIMTSWKKRTPNWRNRSTAITEDLAALRNSPSSSS